MTQIFLGIIGVLVILLGLSGWMLKDQIAENGELQVGLRVANQNTADQKAITAQLQADVEARDRALTTLDREREKDNVRYRKDLQRITNIRRSSDRAAAEHPERYGRIRTFTARRRMRDICRSGGGTAIDCKIDPVRSRKAKPSDPVQPDAGNGDGGTSGEVEPVGPNVDSDAKQRPAKPGSVDDTGERQPTGVGINIPVPPTAVERRN